MLNNVVLTGRLVREPEVQYVGGNETARCTVVLAVQRNFKNSEGEREADFIPVVFWKGAAETIGKYLTKGSLIGVRGRLESYSFANAEGETVRGLRVVAEDFSFLEPRAAQNGDEDEEEEIRKPAQKQAVKKASAGNKTVAGKSAKVASKSVPF